MHDIAHHIAPPPPKKKISDFFLKSQGKEVERKNEKK